MGLDVMHITSDEDHYLPFICTICKNLIGINAFVTAPCSHPFCKTCLQNWCQQTLLCPTCDEYIGREELSYSSKNGQKQANALALSEAQPLAHLCLSRIRVCCPNCHVWRGKYSKLSDHQEHCDLRDAILSGGLQSPKKSTARKSSINHVIIDDDYSDSEFQTDPQEKWTVEERSHRGSRETDDSISDKHLGTSFHSQSRKSKRSSIQSASNSIDTDDDSLLPMSNHSQGIRKNKKLDDEITMESTSERRKSELSDESLGMNSSDSAEKIQANERTTLDDGDVYHRQERQKYTRQHSSATKNQPSRQQSSLDMYNNLADGEWNESDHGKNFPASLESGSTDYTPIPTEIKTSLNDDTLHFEPNNKKDDVMSRCRSRRQSDDAGPLKGECARSPGPGERRRAQDSNDSNRSPIRGRMGLDPINEAIDESLERGSTNNPNTRRGQGSTIPAVRSRSRKEHSALLRDNCSESRHFVTANTLKDQGNSAFNKGEYIEARKLYTEGINALASLQPTSPEESSLLAALYCNRGATYLKEKKYVEAVNDCELALKSNPEYLKAYTRKWRGLMALGHFGEARFLLEKGLHHFPREKSLTDDLIKTLKADDDRYDAHMLLVKGDFGGAISATTQLLSISDCTEISCLAAKAEAANGLIDMAMKRCGNILKGDPRSAEGLQAKGFVLLMAANTEKAAEVIHESLKYDPENQETKSYLKQARRINKLHIDGRAAASIGQFKSASEIFSLALESDIPKKTPLNSLFLTERADAYLHSENYNAAVSDSRAAIEIKMDNVRAWVVNTNANIASGRARDAKKALLPAKRSWGSKNEKILDAYKRADFEVRILEADAELRNMINMPRSKHGPTEQNEKLKRRTSTLSAATEAAAVTSGTSTSRDLNQGDKQQYQQQQRRRQSTMTDVATENRAANGRDDGDNQRRRHSTYTQGGPTPKMKDLRANDTRLGESRGIGSDLRINVLREHKAGPPVTRQSGATPRQRDSAISIESSAAPIFGETQETEEFRLRKTKAMSEADARRRMSMI